LNSQVSGQPPAAPQLACARGKQVGYKRDNAAWSQIATKGRGLENLTMKAEKQLRRYMPASGDFHYGDYPYYWITRVQNIYHQRVERLLKRIGADIPTFRVLFILKAHGTMSISEISENTVTKLSALTRIIQRMKAAKLVEIVRDRNDGRVRKVTLTRKGRTLIDRIEQTTEGLIAASYRGLTDAQITKMNAVLRQIYGNLSKV
jgi:DNA-binding MarR family transcriptional regulator